MAYRGDPYIYLAIEPKSSNGIERLVKVGYSRSMGSRRRTNRCKIGVDSYCGWEYLVDYRLDNYLEYFESVMLGWLRNLPTSRPYEYNVEGYSEVVYLDNSVVDLIIPQFKEYLDFLEQKYLKEKI